MRTYQTLSLAIVLLLAGCSGGEGDDASEDADALAAAENMRMGVIEAPEWHVGDWWSFDVGLARDFNGAKWTKTLAPTIVVRENQSAEYDTAFTRRTDAITYYHWGDIWGGRYAKDLDPIFNSLDSQGTPASTTLDLFKFPMTRGDKWTAQASVSDGAQVFTGSLNVEVFSVENVSSGDGQAASVSAQGVLSNGARDEQFRIDYRYVDAIQHVTHLTLQNESTIWTSMTLIDHGGNYTGAAYVEDPDTVYFAVKVVAPPGAGVNPTIAPAPETFDVTSEYDFLGVFWGFGVYQGGGAASITLMDPERQRETNEHNVPGTAKFVNTERSPLVGQYQVTYSMTTVSFALLEVFGVHETEIQFSRGAITS